MVITPWNAVLAVRVRANDASVCGKPFSSDQARVHARLHRRLKHVAQNVRLAKAAMSVLGEGRMVRYPVFQIETTKPAISQIQFDFFTQPPFRPDAVAV